MSSPPTKIPDGDELPPDAETIPDDRMPADPPKDEGNADAKLKEANDEQR